MARADVCAICDSEPVVRRIGKKYVTFLCPNHPRNNASGITVVEAKKKWNLKQRR